MKRGTRSPFRAASIAACTLALAGCATLERDQVAAPPDGGKVALRSGAPLVVSLPPDPATGYGWVLQSGSPKLPLIGGPDYTPAPKPPGLVGVADTTVFRFRAQAPGDAALVFAWVAPPGQPPAPARTVRYDVKIDPPALTVGDIFATGGGAATGKSAAMAGGAPVESAGGAPAAGKAGSGEADRGPIRYWSF
ncbi:MAG: protease inhibitor I42 family protein [Betaproteobacteria bacterium]|nr:protease inhibitor I42 family protein [Betaproteobacteria bacterium]MCC7215637.1 protease inhibitor I42 family protein [Burkholderiales bacterium]